MTAAGTPVLKPVGPDDRDAWLPLWESYQRFYKVEIAPSVTEVTWERLLSPGEPMFATLAWLDERAVGLVHFIEHRSTWTVGSYCYLQDLFVAADCRGHGVGRRLIEHVYDVAERSGWSRVHWLTHETNTDAMKLYDAIADRSGFVQYRRLLPTGS